MTKKFHAWVNLFIALTVIAALFSFSPRTVSAAPAAVVGPVSDGAVADRAPEGASHRLIVQLDSPSVVEWAEGVKGLQLPNGSLNFQASAVQAYVSQLKAEQTAFVSAMQVALPDAKVDSYINELGMPVQLSYTYVFNGLTVDPGSAAYSVARKTLSALPGVKNVSADYAHEPDLYASVPLIGAPTLWADAAIGGEANAGKGMLFASMDGGAHKDQPMFSGVGYSYPAGWPANGIGMTSNNNGKIVLSRAYFRSFDPPADGEATPWPGKTGTSHGTHTTSTAVGNKVVADYLGITTTLSGVAPAAWIMSYRVFYNSVNGIGSFYNAEGIAALEDIARDGADVLNNSWGGGPSSAGGEFDAIDAALLNTAKSGVFVSMSNGNAGPNLGTGDHPSADYINVAASTTAGTYAAGKAYLSKPEPVPDTLKNVGYGLPVDWAKPLPVGGVVTTTLKSSESVDPANIIGCAPFPADSFKGFGALIRRGTCNFSLKAYYAQQAGAEFVVIYNAAANGDALIGMSAGDHAADVTISVIIIGYTPGNALNTIVKANADNVFTIDTKAVQTGNDPDFIADFSSRGPGVGNVLKPDVAAPGVNILAAGYKDGVSGEARHLGFGQASGTSMASPHVAGAAVLLRQAHPDWSNAYIKSALMSTAKYVGVWNYSGYHAQPLDMGAGRIDLTKASNPGVILDAPSLSFGQVFTDTTLTFKVMSIATVAETYAITSVQVVGTYPTATVMANPVFTASPASITLAPGASATVTVTFKGGSAARGDDYQGYIVLDGATYDAHLPAWARLAPKPVGKVLLIDNDHSFLLGYDNYAWYYASALTNLGIPFDYYDADEHFGNPMSIPPAAYLAKYDAVIYFTGDAYRPDGTYNIHTPPTAMDQSALVEYANQGGVIIAMGQDLAALNSAADDSPPFFYDYVLGGTYQSDSVTGEVLPDQHIVRRAGAPEAFYSVELDLSGWRWAYNDLSGTKVTPPVATTVSGTADFAYDAAWGDLYYDITVSASVTEPITITSILLLDKADAVIDTLYAPVTPTILTETYNTAGYFTLTTADQEAALLKNEWQVKVTTTAYPAGHLAGTVSAAVNGDGAGNQYFIDEITTYFWDDSNNSPGLDKAINFVSLFQYPVPSANYGTVSMAHREQPTLEKPGISYFGRSIYTTFGLEGVNNGLGTTSREELMNLFFGWAFDEITVGITNVVSAPSSNLMMFDAELASNTNGNFITALRWDFGDGTPYTDWSYGPWYGNMTSHTYAECGDYTVRVQVRDVFGNMAVGSKVITVGVCPTYPVKFTYTDVENVLGDTDELYLKGGFNGWDESLKMTRDGNVFTAMVNLKGGSTYGYKYFAKLGGTTGYWGLNDGDDRSVKVTADLKEVKDFRNGKSWWGKVTLPATPIFAGIPSDEIQLELWVRDVTPGAGAGKGLKVMLGYGLDPDDMSSWTWVPMTFKEDKGADNDLYAANVTLITPPGNSTVYFAAALNINSGDSNPNSMVYYMDTDGPAYDPTTGFFPVFNTRMYLPIITR